MSNGHTPHLFLTFLAVVTLAGCASPLPTYPPMSPKEGRRTVAERLASGSTLSGHGRIALTDPSGRRVQLEAAMAGAFPDQLRLRAWKFGQAVFDVTRTGGETWVMIPEGDDGARMEMEFPAERVAMLLPLLGPEFYESATIDESTTTETTLTLTGRVADLTVRCEIDRPTLTPRLMQVAGGSAGGEVRLNEYRVIDGITWPTSIVLESIQGTVALQLDRVEINKPLPEGAFVPPVRALRRSP